ncbi:MAG: glycosyltransferase family 39 protein [Candidatus Omnitrophota bacterium]
MTEETLGLTQTARARSPESTPAKGRLLIAGIFLAVLLFASWSRFYTFFLPHWQGDQSQYVGLARKLDSEGYGAFNLSRLGIEHITFIRYPEWQYIYPVILKEGEPGDFYKAYDMFGIQFNKLPLYHKSPLFPAALVQTHRLLAAYDQPYGVFATKSDFVLKEMPFNYKFAKAQLWASIVPFLSSLGVIILTFFLGRMFFGARIGLLAMFLQALHPVSIVNAYKILADDFASFFATACLILFCYGFSKKSGPIVIVAGMVHGMGILAKQSLVLYLPSFWIFILLTEPMDIKDPRTWLKNILNKYFLLFVAGSLFICFHWLQRVYAVYGDPFFQPNIDSTFVSDKTGWFKQVLTSRPAAIWLFILNIPVLCPLFAFGHLTFFSFIKKIFRSGCENQSRRPVLLMWLCVLSFLMFFVFRVESREERYLLPVYPALSVLSAWGLINVRRWALRRFGVLRIWIDCFLVALFAWSVLWAVSISLESVFWQRFLVLKPWAAFCSFWSGSYRMLTPWTQ